MKMDFLVGFCFQRGSINLSIKSQLRNDTSELKRPALSGAWQVPHLPITICSESQLSSIRSGVMSLFGSHLGELKWKYCLPSRLA